MQSHSCFEFKSFKTYSFSLCPLFPGVLKTVSVPGFLSKMATVANSTVDDISADFYSLRWLLEFDDVIQLMTIPLCVLVIASTVITLIIALNLKSDQASVTCLKNAAVFDSMQSLDMINGFYEPLKCEFFSLKLEYIQISTLLFEWTVANRKLYRIRVRLVTALWIILVVLVFETMSCFHA